MPAPFLPPTAAPIAGADAGRRSDDDRALLHRALRLPDDDPLARGLVADHALRRRLTRHHFLRIRRPHEPRVLERRASDGLRVGHRLRDAPTAPERSRRAPSRRSSRSFRRERRRHSHCTCDCSAPLTATCRTTARWFGSQLTDERRAPAPRPRAARRSSAAHASSRRAARPVRSPPAAAAPFRRMFCNAIIPSVAFSSSTGCQRESTEFRRDSAVELPALSRRLSSEWLSRSAR